MCSLPTVWNQDERFRESYLNEFPGYYKTTDVGFKDEDGYIHVRSRTDDIINVAGHRLSTGGIEEVLSAHKDVAECAVIGIADTLKGEVPCGFVVLETGVQRPGSEIERECVALVREKIGPVAAFKLAITVARLPKTRSGKIRKLPISTLGACRQPSTIQPLSMRLAVRCDLGVWFFPSSDSNTNDTNSMAGDIMEILKRLPHDLH